MAPDQGMQVPVPQMQQSMPPMSQQYQQPQMQQVEEMLYGVHHQRYRHLLWRRGGEELWKRSDCVLKIHLHRLLQHPRQLKRKRPIIYSTTQTLRLIYRLM